MRLLYFILIFTSTLSKSFSQDYCKKFTMSNFIGYSTIGDQNACHWKFEDYFLHIPVFSGGQICQTGGNGNPCNSGYLSAASVAYFDITCNIPIGRVIKITGEECLSVTLNGSPIAINSLYFVEQAPVKSIVIKSNCSIPRTPHFEVCDPYLQHFYVSSSNEKQVELATAFFKPSSETVEFSVATDGTQSSRFVLNLPTLKLKIKEDPDSQSPDIYGFFKQGSKPGEYLYTHPTYIPDNSSKVLTIQVIDENDKVLKEIPLKLYLPPVVMIHGMWGEPDKFIPLSTSLQTVHGYQDFQLLRMTYESNNAFTQSGATVEDYISGTTGAIARMLNEKIAAGKVDIVTHSLGGLVARSYLQLSGNDNKVNKLITVATPHSGSQIANVLHHPSFEVDKVCATFGACGIGSAVNSLRVDGDEITQLNTFVEPAVPSHTIVAKINYTGNEIKGNLDFPLDWITDAMDITLPLLLAIFNGDPNDGMVTVKSQSGGLTGNASSYFSSVTHGNAPLNLSPINKIGELLDANPMSSSFAQSGFYPKLETYNYNLAPDPNNETGDIQVNSPFPGQVVNWGENVEFNVSASNGFAPTSDISHIQIGVLNDATDGSNEGTIEGKAGSIVIPMRGNNLGTTKVLILSKNTENKTVLTKPLEIFVNTTKIPQKLWVDPPFHPALPVGETQRFRIDGFFEDFGATISELPDITYSFSNNKVEYIGNNTIKALETGQTIMTVTFHGVDSKPVPITIVAPDSTSSVSPGIYQESRPDLAKLRVHPNPATEMLHIQATYQNAQDLEIRDVFGTSLLSRKVQAIDGVVEESVDISGLDRGIYFVTLTGNFSGSTAKFIKI